MRLTPRLTIERLRTLVLASGILLVAGAIGYIVTFVLIGRVQPDAMMAATFGVIPLAIGLGFFVDHALIRRDAKAH